MLPSAPYPEGLRALAEQPQPQACDRKGLPVPCRAFCSVANPHPPHRVTRRAPRAGGTSDDAFQELPNQACNWSASLLQRLGIPNFLLEAVPDVPPEHYSCQFRVSKLSR